MAEIKIGRGQEISPHTNHVLVRMTPAGTYQVSGSSNFKKDAPEHFLSEHFPDMGEAMKAAVEWAGEQNIPDIHVDAPDLH